MSEYSDTDRAKFELRFDKTDDNKCWTWNREAPYMGEKNDRHGYGHYTLNGKSMGAHRASWLLYVGPIPTDKPQITHECNVRNCVRPSHLKPDTHKGNHEFAGECGRKWSPTGGATKSKLNAELVVKIRNRVRNNESRCSIARELGVAVSTIIKAACGDTWAHVPGAIPVRRKSV